MVPIKSVIPIPNESEVRLLPEIPPNQDVLALYPGTTCFYKATVVVSPSKNKDPEYLGFYKVRFEDDNNETQFVSPRDVLRVK
ncbi:SGF29 tudor-like domain-containing protein [Jimgerdemannia flammicorona]|uniref:SGF29 tudor-like domain-containing protein n=1 Tax=Jimgerdemannia flammicorona TaxID=994334 RepID=A0A433Q3T0_9FUNG|nr:SGF29 tudor-like domain-containing protein [Jimgerdemannia flammicorona]